MQKVAVTLKLKKVEQNKGHFSNSGSLNIYIN